MAESAAETFDARREVLLAQLEYLVVEAEALGPLLEDLPIGVLTVEFLGEPSVLGAFAELARRDREAYLPLILKVLGDDDHDSHTRIDADHATDSVQDVLGAVVAARTDLLAALSRLDIAGWQARATLEEKELSLFDLGVEIAQNDVEVLRQMAERLRGADLSQRRQQT